MRNPDPMAECRPGHLCDVCNPRTYDCAGGCGAPVERRFDLCRECRAEAAADEDGDRRLNEARENGEAL